ncbi:30S ribosomal protein S3 [candidate division WWE3 bacterium RIFOXYC1_FULL_40_10]|uniref:Small ribosomal subunit protein uS3 n=1 Tax=candidate division WWE3 bacterium RIFOXYA2_FULL_46_9 TaxID=1802636 RepID=A0A1F4VYH6_UNCKA|nr:MAG: 30S ribosomal protein S3 [candidate division WWE3 bacterium RIFOXYB1_FULL_40_22]OGC61863.1 MAG: 30S ribosomal protein S3 [candidate division WWE3 bacterium RIFOXYA1_FULL_40_11]OGC62229.1 MAG: 30S ribosomal protein S3 [candidate division WWE3 bacterium RIFOXYA2_FULL_46_9]OGC64335.1 MAG: 30S ribosomal protein S3 [candidate division WWE3 bacterium RIFOXYB2_FULL_41_6]OGC66246.1 MAG: 30S ribosomal protein S3 [candidate division WWE3 bacterium RIFOXYC1_FULL_40_10]OGC67852.1 MAG: 30S ribosoma
MGHKVNPIGFRVGITRDWFSRWYSPKAVYADLVLEDAKIRKFLDGRLSTAGLKDIEIERTENDVSIIIKVSKPGVVIGKGGTGVEELEKELRKLTRAKIKITAEEVKTPEIEARLVGDYIMRQIKRRVPYRRVVNFAMSSAINKGAKGIKIRVSGVLSGSNTIARTEQYVLGSVPTQKLRANIDYAQLHCLLLYGTIGIKVWVYKGDF